MNAQATDIRSGMILMVLGTMIVPVMDAIAKYLGDSMSPVMIAWGRFLFQALLMGFWLALIKPDRLLPDNLKIHAIRGTTLAVATIVFFTALRYLPLADAIAVFFVQPMILTLISAMFLGETIGWHRKSAVIFGFFGALIIIRPGTEAFSPAAILPIVSALLFSVYLALTRMYSTGQSPQSMQLASGLFATLLLTLVLTVLFLFFPSAGINSLPTIPQWGWLALIGVVAGTGHLAIVMAMKRAPASLLAPFGYVEIIAATVLGWLVFREWPDTITWLGITIIVVSGFYVYLREQQLGSETL